MADRYVVILAPYAALVTMTFGFVMGQARPKRPVEWLTLVVLSALWPLFIAWVFLIERKDCE